MKIIYPAMAQLSNPGITPSTPTTTSNSRSTSKCSMKRIMEKDTAILRQHNAMIAESLLDRNTSDDKDDLDTEEEEI